MTEEDEAHEKDQPNGQLYQSGFPSIWPPEEADQSKGKKKNTENWDTDKNQDERDIIQPHQSALDMLGVIKAGTWPISQSEPPSNPSGVKRRQDKNGKTAKCSCDVAHTEALNRE